MIADMHDHIAAISNQRERDYGSQKAIQEKIL
jgi:hypothetical protein